MSTDEKKEKVIEEEIEDLGADLLATPPHKCDDIVIDEGDEDLGAGLLNLSPHKDDEIIEEEIRLVKEEEDTEEDLGADLLEASTTTGDVAVADQMQGSLVKRDKNGAVVADEDYWGRPCFLVSDEDYLSMSMAKRFRGRYSIKDQRVIAFMREGGYRKPFVLRAGNKILKVKF